MTGVLIRTVRTQMGTEGRPCKDTGKHCKENNQQNTKVASHLPPIPNGKKKFANHLSDGWLIFKNYKEHIQLNSIKTNNPIKQTLRLFPSLVPTVACQFSHVDYHIVKKIICFPY